MANARTIEIILKAISDFGDVKGNIDVIQKSLNQLKLNPQLKQNFSNIFADLQKQTAKYQDYLNSGFKTKGDITGLEKTGNKINALLNQLQTNMNKIDPSVLKESFKIDTTQFEELNNKLKETQNTINQITSSDKFKILTGQVDGVVSKLNTLSKSKAITQFQESFQTGKIEQTKVALDKLIENAKKFNDEGKQKEYLGYVEQLKTAFNDLSKIEGLQKANNDLKDFSSQLESLGTKQLEDLLNTFAQGKINVQNFVNAVKGYSNATAAAAKKTFEFGSEIDHFKNRTAYFLGLTNSINLFKRALQKALETVKELDAVMTETAVVTDFTVGDMWEKLPEYAAHAKELGSSIKDVYAATTLYYQQGLKTNEAMSVGVETMKMARIANLEAGDATQYMTAALRGFNMEVDELNAQRVNDVYSELAAITAADTSQIATAMSKTASIASAANMEFETTAALLAQIIETTQEAPETAGTALKTIIARFSEVKKLREEGQSTGKDEEGEAIDVNKIQAALRTVGISMDEFFQGTEGLDSILLKLAEKWKDLDFETQRYIATTAAGSRQQSRFIAMMSDYERTMELATAANNSAGASQQQFDKTLDSMEAKLAKLTTAWQEFTMGLANNEFLKGAVDALTFVLNAINKLIDALSGNNGIAKSVITLNLAIAAIGGMRKVLNNLFSSKFFGVVKNAFKQIPIEASSAATEASNSIVDTITAGFKTLEVNAANSGAVAGQAYGQSFNTGAAQYINSTNIPSSTTQDTTTKQPIQNTQSSKQAKEGEQSSKEIIKQQTGLQKAWNASSTSAFRLGGILTSLTGTGLNLAASSALAKDETSAFGTGLKSAGSVASVAGSAISILAPVLTAAGVAIGPVIAGVAALTVVVGLLSAAIKNEYNNSIEGRLEAAQKATEKAKEAAEEAKVAYDALLQSKSDYDEIQNSLNGLTQGTNEWKAALAEANQQVLQLLETYPQLAQSIRRGEYGQLEIIPDGWKDIIDLTSNQAINTSRMYSASQLSEIALDKEAKKEDLYSELATTDSANSGIYKDVSLYIDKTNKAFEVFQNNAEAFISKQSMTYEEFVKQYKKAIESNNIDKQKELQNIWKNSSLGNQYGDISTSWSPYASEAAGADYFKTSDGRSFKFNSDEIGSIELYDAELLELAKETELTAYELSTMRNSFADYDSWLSTYTQKLQIYTEELLSNLDGKAAESEYAYEVVSGMTKNYAQSAPEKINETKTELLTETGIQKLAKELNDTGIYSITDTTGSDETYKQIYEQLTGSSAGDKGKEALAEEIAKYQVSEDWSNTAEKLIDSLDSLAKVDSEKAKLAAASISGNTGELNYSEIQKLQNFSVQDWAEALGYKYDEVSGKSAVQQNAEDLGYENKTIDQLNEVDQIAAAKAYAKQLKIELNTEEEIQNMIQQMQDEKVVVTAGLQFQIDNQQMAEQAAKEMDGLIGKIKGTLGEEWSDSSIFTKMSKDALEGLVEQSSLMGEKAGKEYLQGFETLMNDANANEQVANYLSTVNWSSMTEAAEAMDFMQSMELDPSNIKAFWDSATNGANTYISSVSEAMQLMGMIRDKISKVSGIEERLEKGTATEEDITQLMNAGVDISNFEVTPEGWTATAEEIKEATKQLRIYNAEQAAMIAQQQAEAATAALNNDDDGITQREDGTFSILGNTGLGKITTMDDSGRLVAGTVTQNNASEIAAIIGETGYNAETETYDEFIARIQTAYESYINLLNNNEDIQIIADKASNMAAAAGYSTTDEAVQAGIGEEGIRQVMKQEAIDNGLDPQEVVAYSDSLEKLGITSQQVRDQIAIDNAKMNQGAKEINDSWDEWKANLSQINTSDYSKALEELKASTNKLLNINDDLSDSFYENAQNQKLIKEAAKGNTQALNELQKAAAKEIFSSLGEDSKLSAEYLDKLISTISDTSMAVGEVATLGEAISSNDIAYQLSMMYSDAYYAAIKGGKSVEEAIAMANQAIAAQGFEAPEMVEKEVTVTGDLPDGWTPGPDGNTMLGPDGQSLEGVTWKQNESGTYTYTQTMLVPKAKDSGFTKTQETIGGGSRGKSSGGGGGGGGGGSTPKKWENPYDEFYNAIEKINEELRTREKLERRYQNLLKKTDTKASDLVKNAQKQLESLQAEKELHENLLNGRKRQMSDVENEYKDLQKYARYNEELGVIEIDWEKINALDGSKNEKLTSRIEDYIKELEERQSQIEEEEDALADIEEAIWEIYDQGKDEYFDLEQKIKDALVNQRQQEIDKLSAINDSINDTNSRLIDAMRSSIEKYRQDRENARTEEELSNKQRRLAYLRQDTSGANALEIKQLEEELAQGQEDYTDSLIDQKINELQEQNDQAAEQRERQIDIMQKQLDQWVSSGRIWEDAYKLMSSGIDENGIIIGSDLYELLAQNEDYASMSNLEKLEWAEKLVDQTAQAVQWLTLGNSTEALMKKGELSSGQQITFTTSDGDLVTGTLQDNGDIVDSQGNTYTGVYRDQEGNWVTEEKTKKAESGGGTPTGETGDEEDTSNQQQTNYPYGKASEVSGEVKYGDKGKKVKAIQWALKKLGYSIGSSGIDGIFGNDTLKAVKKFQRNSKISADGIVGKNTKKAFKLKQYASGGLADFTGPAWLDGTKSKPEYILSADQTKAFFRLVDILEGLQAGSSSNSQISGDSIYDIDINVESIGNDYDVEKMASTIKRMINDDARYRNNNAINLSR